jgi:hypothetical protein
MSVAWIYPWPSGPAIAREDRLTVSERNLFELDELALKNSG